MKQFGAAVLSSFVLLASGCGTDSPDPPGAPDAGPPDPPISLDASPPDAAEPAVTCDVPEATAIGGTCSAGDPCAAPPDGGAGLFPYCLDSVQAAPAWPAHGFCTAFFCTVDADCGDGNVCGSLPDGFGGTFTACLPACCDGVGPGMACSEGRICAESLFGDQLGGVAACVPGTAGTADGARCSQFSDCDVNSICRQDPFQFPNGQCATVKCESDADCAAGGDGRCETVDGADICVDGCSGDSDCRMEEGYRCLDRRDGVGMHCQRPQPGDDCSAATDCGLGGKDPWTCRTGATYPDGYCTVVGCDVTDNDSCPIRSFCVELQEEGDAFCADQCTAGSDECGSGYECAEIFPPNVGGSARNVCIPAATHVALP